MSDELELQLTDPPKPNGKHFCTERALLEHLGNGQHKLETEQTLTRTLMAGIAGDIRNISTSMRGLADHQGVLSSSLVDLDLRIGRAGADPTNADASTGLTGAVHRIANRQLRWEADVSSMRPRLQSIEDAGEITKTHSLDELVGRVHAAEALSTKLADEARQRAAQIEADAWAEAKARAEWKRQLTIKVVAIVGAALTSSAGLVWLARVFQ